MGTRLCQRYFFYGLVVASMVWASVLLLYTQMMRVSNHTELTGGNSLMPHDKKPVVLKWDQQEYVKQNDRPANVFLYKDRVGGMRFPQKDEEDNLRLLAERQNGVNAGKEAKMSFDEFMFQKQQVHIDEFHNDHQLETIMPKPRLFPHPKERPDVLRIDDSVRAEVLGPGNDPDLESLGIIRTAEDQQVRDEGQRLYAFNLLVSNRLGYHRSLPDTRHERCRSKIYPQNLPSTSIVICFHNEALSALLRTLHSIVDRTPPLLLHEIVLVDDFSDIENLKTELETYLGENIPQVHLYRTNEREGLIRARLLGAEKATGEVLVFLDSHCEVNELWLPPLLARVKESSSTMAIPVVDIIDQDTFQYEASPLVRGGFNWGLHFRWDNIPPSWFKDHDPSDPLPTPTMSGGLFAVNRRYFYDIGAYDPGLEIWGGENVEISFRTWQCGGRLEIVPCSRVGHVFRKRRPYTSPGGDAMLKNSLRVAKVWMDEYAEHFYKIRPDAAKTSYGDISERVELRKRLGCQSFKWYLENVYPEQPLPVDGQSGFPKGGFPKKDMPAVIKEGHLQHRSTKLCVAAEDGVLAKRSRLRLVNCEQNDKDQVWSELDNNSLRLSEQLCLDAEGGGGGRKLGGSALTFPTLSKCHFSGGSQQWRKIGHFQTMLFNPASGKCLSVDSSAVGAYLTMQICNDQLTQLHFDLRSFV